MTAYLFVKAGVGTGNRYALNPQHENQIGRDWECDVALNDPQCSRVHATIVFRESAWWIADSGSSNGTYVNGQTIDEAQLIDGNEVRVGGSTLTFSTTNEGEPVSDQRTTNIGEPVSGRQTLVFDEMLNPSETGQYTLDFLRGHNWGQDFFVLFQLSVKLLGIHDPDEVIRVSVHRLFKRTDASVAGFMSLSDESKLRPRVVFPEQESEKLKLNETLTRRVVKQRRTIRIEHDTKPKGGYADLICVPLVSDDKVIGALHLYREREPFRDTHLKLATAISNIIVLSLNRANREASLAAEHESLSVKSAATDELIGESEPMLQLKSKIARVARASGSVLIRGESGSGKELVARALHRTSPRASRPMLSVNCAAMPRDLMESQLFGHKKGAFTSADSDHVGLFQRADMGTLFLDEIGELTLEGQAKLLRILEGHPFLPVGGSQEITVDVRVICATNRDLREFVSDNKFREDLYYRLSVFELYIPPLRKRGSDIQRLVDHFVEHFRKQHNRPNLTLSDEAREMLLSFQWPGNVRQLRNVVDSAVVMAEGDSIVVDDLGIRETNEERFGSLKIDYWERKLIGEALQRTDGNVPNAAKLLGISRATLYRKIDDYGIER